MAKARASQSEAMQRVVHALAQGTRVEDAMIAVGRSRETYFYWRKKHPEFREKVDSAKARAALGTTDEANVPDFPEFCETYFEPLPRHQLRAWQVINGTAPDDLEESMQLQWSGAETNNRRIILNFPPDHAKSTVWAIQYVVWKIHRNPNYRCIIISQTQDLARQFIQSIQRYLLDPMYSEMHEAFAPKGGWKDPSLPWTKNYFYVNGRDTADPDPTVQALGMGQQIYGRRCDDIIADDVETLQNLNLYKNHSILLCREADSRLRPAKEDGSDPGGLLLVLGTRVGAMDLYRWLRDEARCSDNTPAFTYFKQPAILSGESMGKEHWEVLWPERMHRGAIAQRKAIYPDKRQFELIYQQNDISDDATFPMAALLASINQQRYPGIMDPSVPGHPPQGMHGMYVTAGLDPATVGGTGMVVIASDRVNCRRYVVDAFYKKNCMPDEMIGQIKALTDKYHINEWRVERNAFQRFLTQLNDVKDYMSARGCLFVEHMTTGQTKWDADWGVETLRQLFMSCVEETGMGNLVPRRREENGKGHLIELPKQRTDAIRALVYQLSTWEPGEKNKATDMVMALWFAEIAAREYLLGRRMQLTKRDKGKFCPPAMERKILSVDQARIEDMMRSPLEAYGAWG